MKKPAVAGFFMRRNYCTPHAACSTCRCRRRLPLLLPIPAATGFISTNAASRESQDSRNSCGNRTGKTAGGIHHLSLDNAGLPRQSVRHQRLGFSC
ncbi:MAG TPA: hypothetical protein VF050_06565, partial [Moraxellaceae bacterium]